MAEQLRDISSVNTQPLGEPLDEMALEAPVEQPQVPMTDPAFWQADRAKLGAMFDEMRRQIAAGEGDARDIYVTYVGDLAMHVYELLERSMLEKPVEVPKAPKKRTAKVPKAALPAVEVPETPDEPDAA